jgi:plastocyanin
MTHTSYRRTLIWVAAFTFGLGFQTLAFAAATVKGTINLPPELKTGRRFLGHWRVENTNVAGQNANTRGGTVVLLVTPQFQAVPPKNVSVEISGLQATPAAVVVSQGTVVEFKNLDKVAHELSVPNQSQIMSLERLAAGSVRKQRFDTAGEYVVRCNEYPHLTVSVIVNSTPLFAIAEDKGAFKISDVPEGHATLKVWSNGRWVHEQEVDVTSRGLDLSVKVQGSASATENVE